MSEQGTENIRVAVRFRPEAVQNEKIIISPDQGLVTMGSHQFIFDHVFPCDSTQKEIFDTIIRPAIDWVSQGYNSTIFAYGNTSSGKSYTIFGPKENPGVVPRSCEALFSSINSNDQVAEANMKCSFLEIYRENIRDLLQEYSPIPEIELKIRQNSSKQVYVQGLLEKYVYSPQEILSIINKGTLQRVTASTSLNDTSSRSHAVLTLTLTQKFLDGSETVSKLNIIDLAGSENVGKSEAKGINLLEAQNINKSLSALGNVIYAITEKNRDHIPYRDSKLTFLLRDSIGGNSKTIIIATASMSYFETLNTLKFANRAKDIKNVPKVNRNESNSNLLKTIDLLNQKIAELEGKYEDSQIIVQAIEKVDNDLVSREMAFLRAKCERLEKRISGLELTIKKEEERCKSMKDIFEKQRTLAQTVSKDLYKERIRTCIFYHELEQYRVILGTLKEAVKTPNILEILISKAVVSKSPLYTECNLGLEDGFTSEILNTCTEIDSPL